jgi:hypothetical protein
MITTDQHRGAAVALDAAHQGGLQDLPPEGRSAISIRLYQLRTFK